MTPQRQERIRQVLHHRQPDLTVVMENVHDPHNISAVMRTCDSVGVQELYVLDTRKGRPHRFGKKSSASAAEWLTVYEFSSTEDCVAALRKKNYLLAATHLGEHAVSLYELELTRPVALIFGNEHAGVTDELLQHCDTNFIIPQVGMVRSLNISVACAVSLYEAFRQRQLAGFYDGMLRMPQEQYGLLSEKWAGKNMLRKLSAGRGA